jgi:hypothetical protein
MVVEAHDKESGESHFFEVNFPAKHGAEYQFMWFDGRRRVLEVRHLSELPADASVQIATLDAPSHEIFVQSGR